ncbi:Amino-acid acetyltransferase mitochondrial [Ceratocystis platani]|uniref:Amino-acid acetyltransferase, mitochondrial n=1 Tax=Ceratocystis fimbriata f. sp. platani TaxID=88771 RepID=A0A0F8DP68_CERFI|nr:Amino-acid acetyltransferase mitochondrial [Ceratocystis platani]
MILKDLEDALQSGSGAINTDGYNENVSHIHNCIDLPKLSHLIKDSFGRELDVAKYLKRMENDLAGIIIAGNYEGAAILTWERPSGLTEEMAYKENRFVPYLDKFAVLRSSQGTSGVADILFNSMVRDCFPQGVCWRSRMNNPVNKWYFERSQGTMKLPDTHWTMFWTTPKLFPGEMVLKDYEDVCRKIQPTWLD